MNIVLFTTVGLVCYILGLGWLVYKSVCKSNDASFDCSVREQSEVDGRFKPPKGQPQVNRRPRLSEVMDSRYCTPFVIEQESLDKTKTEQGW